MPMRGVPGAGPSDQQMLDCSGVRVKFWEEAGRCGPCGDQGRTLGVRVVC